MRQKEVMGQSMRTTKSARPGSVVYVPMDKSEFRSIIFSEKKKNKIKKIVILMILMIFVIGCCMYAGISYYYSYHFFYGTTINGIDSSNKTAYEVEQEIAGKKDNYTIQVRARMQDPQAITGKDIDYKYVSSGAVLQLLKTQKSWEWISGLLKQKLYGSGKRLLSAGRNWKNKGKFIKLCEKENQIAPENAYVSFDANSRNSLLCQKRRQRIKYQEAYQMICRAIDNDAAEVDLESDPKAYKKADVTKESSELQNMVNTYKNLTKANITYTFGDETVTLDGNTIKNWLQFDEKGQLLQNDEAFRQHVVDYVAQLAADHDTVGTERQFQTTSGRTVYVYGSAYGWKIDQDKEVAQLMQEIQSGTQTTREPVYSMRANAHGINDLGDTYIEVDLTEQYMWYYQNGNIIFQSEIVSGLPSDPDRKTPPGIFTLNSKSSPSVLRGEMTANGTYSYEQPVTYWMPFNGGIGFHDADWQPYFGGDRYLTGGSHGCINLPPENAGQLYSLIQYDVPIICFY